MAILVTILVYSFGSTQAGARDAERQSDLKAVQIALDLYKQKYGRYPERCPSFDADWSGQDGTNYACSSGSQYIIGLAPEFIPTLPRDPRAVERDQGYAYTVNADGSVYKFMARGTVEDDEIDYDHPFRSCDKTNDTAVVVSSSAARRDCPVPHSTGRASVAGCDVGICDRLYSTSNHHNRTYQNAIRTNGGHGNMVHCSDGDEDFETSYAVWGGLAEPLDSFYSYAGSDATTLDMLLDMSVERETEKILCLIP